MYIQPNSDIYLLAGIPLDNTYTDTIWFDNATSQYNWFNGKAVRRFTEQYYQRVNRNRIRVNVSSDLLYNCNYLMFRNTNFGNRWFYAFITKPPEYINNAVAEIEYEIDVMQTWLFDYQMNRPVWVERNHTVSDVIGQNVVAEPFQLGEPICYDYEVANEFKHMGLLITTAYPTAPDDTEPSVPSVGG